MMNKFLAYYLTKIEVKLSWFMFKLSAFPIFSNLVYKLYPYPLMSKKERNIINAFLERFDIVFEYGAGRSTIYFPSRHKHIKWYSVENNAQWYSITKNRIMSQNLTNVELVYRSNSDDYINMPSHINDKPKLYLMDGANDRVKSSEYVSKILSHNNICLLHDSENIAYDIIDNFFQVKIPFTKGNKAGVNGLTVFYNSIDKELEDFIRAKGA